MGSEQHQLGIIIYTLYGHIGKLAESVAAGVKTSGLEADIYQVAETLPPAILEKLHAPPKPKYPIATAETLTKYDGLLFGIPTRYGNFPSQLKAFIDSTGGLWASGALYQKPYGVFVSTGTGGGRESTAINSLSTFVHHGLIYVPLGFAPVFQDITNLNEVHGATPWGAGTIAGADGSRQPSELELRIAKVQGTEFAKVVKKL
ncbi:unnamed protein product [Ambrosiozyma monospora]|uniref:Unnamed protein product n=1 Tax=Ambrosiozyma monospora TaxID=43982 RepID=A0ACB5T7V4_AMBMO|nr:unnamed protein product [Ambrosiozyma monospora]